MSKKNLIVRAIVIFILIGMLIPIFATRITNENKNKDVVFSINYNNAHMVLSEEEFEETLNENKKMRVNTLLIGEESVNSLINAGFVTGIKYNVLCHKYDDESEEIIKLLDNNKKIHNDSYVLITKRSESKAYLEKWIPAKFSKDEFTKVTTPLGADVYVIYQGVVDAWKLTTGFDERKIEDAHSKGFNIALSMMLDGYSNTDYLKYIEEIIVKYNVKFINVKEAFNNESNSPLAKKNYEALCKIIDKKDLYLVVTENQDQLSNQRPIGYDEIVKTVGGKVLRGYETVDFGAADLVGARYHQIVNSVVDRNIRFVVINQLTSSTDTFKQKSDKTNAATKATIDKLASLGFDTDSYDTEFDYTVNRRAVSAIAMVIMIVMGVTLLELLFGKAFKKLEIVGVIGAVLSIGFTLLAPETIVSLYPTLFAALAPCFALTVVMVYVKNFSKKLNTVLLVFSSVVITLVTLALCGVVQASLLAGLDYYINSLIFRGIKLSLLLPIVYGAVAYGIIYVEMTENYITKIIEILKSEIKVYWVIIAGAIGGAGLLYLIRSGNVSSISSTEAFMRNTITEFMMARPRTKEFLIGWPCLVLMCYYLKNTKLKLVQWILTVGASILFASVINSFCHVFTAASIIYSRVINGVLLGGAVSAFAIVANVVVIEIVKWVKNKIAVKNDGR